MSNWKGFISPFYFDSMAEHPNLSLLSPCCFFLHSKFLIQRQTGTILVIRRRIPLDSKQHKKSCRLVNFEWHENDLGRNSLDFRWSDRLYNSYSAYGTHFTSAGRRLIDFGNINNNNICIRIMIITYSAHYPSFHSFLISISWMFFFSRHTRHRLTPEIRVIAVHFQ